MRVPQLIALKGAMSCVFFNRVDFSNSQAVSVIVLTSGAAGVHRRARSVGAPTVVFSCLSFFFEVGGRGFLDVSRGKKTKFHMDNSAYTRSGCVRQGCVPEDAVREHGCFETHFVLIMICNSANSYADIITAHWSLP